MDAFRNEDLRYFLITSASTVAFYLSIQFFSPKICEFFLEKRYKSLPPEDRSYVANSIVSGLNGAFAFIAICYILANYDLRSDMFWTDNVQIRVFSCTQAGYFIADLLVLLKSPGSAGRFTYFGHHITCLLAYYVVTVFKVFAFHMALRTLNEFSTPFFNARYVLATLKMKEDRIYVVNGMIFLVTFFIGRILVIPLTYYTMALGISSDGYRRLDPICRFSFYFTTAIIDLLNVYWFVLIVRGFLKYFSNARASTSPKNR